MRSLKFLLIILGLATAWPAHAVLPELQVPTAEETEPAGEEGEISQDIDEGSDERITERISGIFTELPGFENVDVSTSEGVVSLTGTLPDAEAIARAENIAARVSGVVTVENQIERDLSVEQNLSIIGRMADLADNIVAMLPLIVVAIGSALVIILIGYLISGLGNLWRRVAPNSFMAELVRSAIRFVFIIGGIIVALDILGAGTLMGAVLGGAGVIGFALGFAMRDTIENYVASLMLSMRQPFRANEWVLIDDYEGRVIRLTSRATILMTLDGNHLRIPNSQVFKAVILNYTRNPERRLEFDIGIDADDDPRAAIEVGADALKALNFVLDHPEAAGRIEQVGDSNIVIRFLAWIDQNESDWYKSRTLAIAAVKDALEQAGFGIPEPIYRLRVDSRSDPLPIGRSAAIAEAPQREEKAKPISPPAEEDVQPAAEIAEMVEKERSEEGGQSDLLDPSRPVE